MQWNEFVQTDHSYTEQEWPYSVGVNQLAVRGELKLLRNNMPINQEGEVISSDAGQTRISLNESSDLFESMSFNLVISFSEDEGPSGYQLSNLTNDQDNLDVLLVTYSKSARYYNTHCKPLISGQAVFEKVKVERDDVFENVIVQAFLVLREDSQAVSDRGALKKGSVISFSRNIEILTDEKLNLFKGGITSDKEMFEGAEEEALYKIKFNPETEEPVFYWNEKFDDIIRFMQKSQIPNSKEYMMQDMMGRIISYGVLLQLLAGLQNEGDDIDILDEDSVEMKIMDNASNYIKYNQNHIWKDMRDDLRKLNPVESLTRLQSGLKIGQKFNQYINSGIEEASNE